MRRCHRYQPRDGVGVVSRDLATRLEWLEVNSRVAPDCRRVLRDERFAILAARRRGDRAGIVAAETEARRVMQLWGVS